MGSSLNEKEFLKKIDKYTEHHFNLKNNNICNIGIVNMSEKNN